MGRHATPVPGATASVALPCMIIKPVLGSADIEMVSSWLT
jgi:hypothetical protein